MCCASNHQNNIEMAQGHISLSISPFLVIYANTSKSNSNSTNISKRAKKSKLKTNKVIIDLAYLDHFLPPLGFFCKTNSFSYLHVKTLVLAN
jgi:hypothetical protein